MAILEVKNISKSFDSLKVLKDISFNVEVGEVVAIIGPTVWFWSQASWEAEKARFCAV